MGFALQSGQSHNFVKIDVEGSEVAALRGARGLLSRPDRPAILFEYNPFTLRESGSSVRALLDLLSGYRLHYVDDLRGQKIRFGAPIQEADEIDWICNLFAVPLAEIFEQTNDVRINAIKKTADGRGSSVGGRPALQGLLSATGSRSNSGGPALAMLLRGSIDFSCSVTVEKGL